MATTTASSTDLKTIVRDKYTDVVLNNSSCCGTTSCCGSDEGGINFSSDYASLEGYVADADYGLGCGLPTEHAGIRPGDTVLDLGSGAGNDAFVARHLVGEEGHVIGVDFTPAMIEKARANAASLGVSNVEFREGDIEALPIDDAVINVAVSNCVLNLVPDKPKAFAEMWRVLKPGAHFCVSDIVTRGPLPDAVREVAELYAGCVSGAIEQDDYVRILEDVGFEDVQVVQSKRVDLPDSELRRIISEDELISYRASGSALLSVTVVGTKPAA